MMMISVSESDRMKLKIRMKTHINVSSLIFPLILFFSSVGATTTMTPAASTTALPKECLHPDNASDYLDVLEKNGTASIGTARPPPPFDNINITSIGVFSIKIGWTEPKDTYTHLCHFKISYSYTSLQRGSLRRVNHKNINRTSLEAELNDLTPDTNVTIRLSACFYLNDKQFVCTASTNATVRTLPADCPKGKYNGTDGICVPCECSGNSEICENQSGKCLDCLRSSDGDRCELCISGHVRNGTGYCVAMSHGPDVDIISTKANPTGSSTTSSTAKQTTTMTTTTQATTTRIVTTQSTITPSIRVTTPDTAIPSKRLDHSLMVIIVICALSGLAVVLLLTVIFCRKYRNSGKSPVQFWTIQLQNDGTQPSVAFSDVLEPQFSREDNRLIDSDYSQHRGHQFESDENPYRTLTA